MSMAEWDRTPWYEQQLLREGLEAEAPWIGRVAMLSKASDSLDLRAGLFADPVEQEEPDDLASFGIQIRQSTKLTPVYKAIGE